MPTCKYDMYNETEYGIKTKTAAMNMREMAKHDKTLK